MDITQNRLPRWRSITRTMADPSSSSRIKRSYDRLSTPLTLTSSPQEVLAAADLPMHVKIQLLSAPSSSTSTFGHGIGKKQKRNAEYNNDNINSKSNNNNNNRLVCASCKESKLPTEFSKNQKRKQASHAKCRSCCLLLVQQQDKSKATAAMAAATATTIVNKPCCSVCKKQKKPSQFRQCSDGSENESDDLVCKSCAYKHIGEAPRQCSQCGITKTKECFSPYQWIMATQRKNPALSTCLECLPLMVENWNRAEKDIFLPMAKKGLLFYEFPEKEKLEQCYSHQKQHVENLVGMYKILYHHGQADHTNEYHERTTRGTLTLSTATVPLDYPWSSTTILLGRVVFDQSLPNETDVDYFYKGYTILDTIKEEEEEQEPPGEPVNHHHPDDQDHNAISSSSSSPRGGASWNRTFGFVPIRGEGLVDPGSSSIIVYGPGSSIIANADRICTKMHVLQKRVACPWVPLEGCTRLMLENEFGVDKLTPTLETVEQAEKLVEQHLNRTNCMDDASWICKHLHLPPDVAKRILAFATSRPSPVFFMEPGDLLLETAWTGSFNFPFTSHIVARKIQE